jgi:hypothetical protein
MGMKQRVLLPLVFAVVGFNHPAPAEAQSSLCLGVLFVDVRIGQGKVAACADYDGSSS